MFLFVLMKVLYLVNIETTIEREDEERRISPPFLRDVSTTRVDQMQTRDKEAGTLSLLYHGGSKYS